MSLANEGMKKLMCKLRKELSIMKKGGKIIQQLKNTINMVINFQCMQL